MAKAPTPKPKAASKKAALPKAAEAPKPLHPALIPRPPIPFSRIVGQDRALRVLTASAASGRVHHAWVFAGPMGVGKRTAAEAFAALLLDPTSRLRRSGFVEPDPDSEVQSLLAAGTHPDMHVIVKELAAYSDDPRVRSAKQTTIAKDVLDTHLLGPIARAASVRSDSLASKVFIVDEAELLDRSITNATSQNALLKTLEEPPPGSVIILVTAQEDRLLPTIRSRCQRVGFSPLDDEAMEQWLETSGRAVPRGGRQALWTFAGGSPGRAVLALDTGLIEWADALSPLLADAARGRYRVNFAPVMATLTESWATAAVERAEKAGAQASKEAASQEATRHLVALLSEWARRRLRDAADDAPVAERALRDIDAIARAERAMHANVQPVLVLEDLAAGLCATAQ
jgi:DNA polymerase-3 subunit delta'